MAIKLRQILSEIYYFKELEIMLILTDACKSTWHLLRTDTWNGRTIMLATQLQQNILNANKVTSQSLSKEQLVKAWTQGIPRQEFN